MKTALRLSVALFIVLICSTETRSSEIKPRQWRVIYCEDDGSGECYRGKPRTLAECLAELRKIWDKERLILTCSAEATYAEKQADEEIRQSLQESTSD